jgi:hypothetical protein
MEQKTNTIGRGIAQSEKDVGIQSSSLTEQMSRDRMPWP